MSNTEQKQKILLKRTTEVDKQPIPSGASHGELFLNIASGANAHNKIATMQIGTNEAIIWSDDAANEKKFASKTEVEALVKEVEDNELVTATAISTMNASAGFNEDGSSVLEGGVSLSEAIIELQNKTQDQGNYYFYLNESGELASNTISDEEIEKLRNSKNIYVVDNNNGIVFNCDFTASAFGEIGVLGSVTTWNTNNTVATMTVQIAISPTENRVTLVTNDFYVASSYLLRVTCDDTTGVIGRNTFISSSEIEEIRKSNIVFVKIELPEGGYTFSCSKKDDNDSIITLVGSQVYGLDGYWTNTSKIVSLIITIDASTNGYSGQIYNIVTGEHSKLADSATTSISATTAVSASTSEKAYKDGSGNVISSTYASKTELDNLIQEVEDSEFVTANALTQINKSAGFTEGGISKLPDQQSLTDAIIELQNKTQDLEESDPIFTDSPAADIKSEDIEKWNDSLRPDGDGEVYVQVDKYSSQGTSYAEFTHGNIYMVTNSTDYGSGMDNQFSMSKSDGIKLYSNDNDMYATSLSILPNGVFINESEVITRSNIGNFTSTSPVIKGTATNSAVLNGTYLERDNQAISQLSMATGAGANAGLKGYYYEGIDFTNKKIYLSNKTTLPTTIKTSGFNTYSNFSCGYSVGDVISIVNGKKYDRCSKITAISNNVITLDSLPFTQDEAKLSLLTDIIGEEIPNEFSVNVVKRLVDDYDVLSVTKHNVGIVDLGGGAHAEGVNTFATNIGAHAEGFQSLAYGQASHAEGIGTQASYASHAEGESTQGTGDASHAEGKNTIASGDKSHAEGYGTRARGHHSHAEGVATIASGTNAHAEGDSTTASGYGSHAEGISTIASGTNAHAEGELTQAIGNDSHAEGYGTQAIGSRAHAEGDSTQAVGKDSHAGGNGSIAEGDRSFAHGDNVRASGANALALGKNSIAAGHNSIAAGHESQTNNTRSFAMGYICKTEGNDSMAFGYECSTAAAKSAAIGNRAKSTNIGEFACGSYNATGDTQLFSVGCGTSDTSRKNAFHITNSSGIISAYVDNKKISTEGHKHSPAELGLESALKYHGVTTTPLTDGATTKPITIGGVSHYQSAGCVVIYTTTASGDTEFVWNGSSWEKLGDGINYKVKQEAVSDPAANGSSLTFIDTISQDTNGVIKPTKKSVNLANYSLSGHNHDDRYYTKTEINTKLVGKSDSGHTHSYLPLSGGTISDGTNYNPLTIKGDKNDKSAIWFRDGYGNELGGFGFYMPSDTAKPMVWYNTEEGIKFDNLATTNDIPVNTDTATTESGHYTPSSSTTKGTTATTSNYIKGIRMDAKGHVTDVITGTVLTSYTETYKGTITGVTAGTGLTGGGSQSTGSKSVTLSISTDYQNKIASGVSAYTMVKELIQDIEDNELVIATALNHMNASAGFDNLGQSTLPNKQSLTDAIVELKDNTGKLNVTAGTGAYRLVGVSATATKYNLIPYINSAVYMENGSIFAASDRTLKTHIEDVDGSLDKIKRIPKAYFHWNNDEDKKRQMGTYAQDLEEVYPELVTKDKDGIRAVAYDRLGVVALAGIDKLYDIVQELMKKNDELEKRIKELENK